MPAPSAQDVAQWIAAGDMDGGLVSIVEALQTRFTANAAAFRWEINLPQLDLEISEDDLTLDEAMLIEKMLGITWGEIEPVSSAAHARAILAVCLARRQDLTPTEADEQLRSLKVVDLLNAISRVEVNPAPLDSPA